MPDTKDRDTLIKRTFGGEGVGFHGISIQKDYFLREAMQNAREQGYGCSCCGLFKEEETCRPSETGLQILKGFRDMTKLETDRTSEPMPEYDGGMGFMWIGKEVIDVAEMEKEANERPKMFVLDTSKVQGGYIPCSGWAPRQFKSKTTGKWISVIDFVDKKGEVEHTLMVTQRKNGDGVVNLVDIESLGLPKQTAGSTDRKLKALSLK